MNLNKMDSYNPFQSSFSKEKMVEKIAFSVMRSATYFVLFCAAYLFWDIFSKGSNKLFEGDGINWEFLTQKPQTLHVIEANGTTQKLSSEKYYKFKEKKTLEKWEQLTSTLTYIDSLKFLEKNLTLVLLETSISNLEIILENLILVESQSSNRKFEYWISLLSDAELTAKDFEIKESQVFSLVSSFIKSFFSTEGNRFRVLESEIAFFKANYFQEIASPDTEGLNVLRLKYLKFLETHLPKVATRFRDLGKKLHKSKRTFFENPTPQKLTELSSAATNYLNLRKLIFRLNENESSKIWEAISSNLETFNRIVQVEIQSKDFSYSGGGIFPAIVGSILLVVGAMVIAILLGVFCAIFLAEYGKSGRFLSMIRLAILNLSGVPSIIFGLFGFGLFVIFLDWNVSLIAGWFTLAIMVLPIIITASEESLRSIPQGFRESSLALGASKWTMIRTSVLPYAMPGIITSSILGVARVAGETAPIMFTAAYAKRSELPWEGLEHWSDFFFQGVMALPYHIYIVSTKIPQNEYTIDMQYGTALVFLVFIIAVTSLSVILRSRLRKKYRW